ncbi:MAG: hypothetical protein ACKON9_03675, partial [Planctomycetaceae bacterium]
LIRPELEDPDKCRIAINERHDALAKKKLFLEDLVASVLEQQPEHTRLLLVVDQWEELYTQCTDADLRAKFIDSVLATIAKPHVRLTVVFTIRWDFYGQVFGNRPLLDAIGKSRLDLGPMNSAELQQVIEQPATETGLRFESGLVQRIVEAAERDSSNLPLLEFLLHQLWENKTDDNELTHQVYQDAGELQGAISRYADDYYENKLNQVEKLNEAERAACGSLFRQLVRAGLDASKDTRRRADLSKLSETEQSAAGKLIDARLLISGAGISDKDSGQPEGTIVRTVEVAHEELLRRWERLRGWVNEDREFLQWRTSLETQLMELKRDHTALLRGRRLQDARRYYAKRADDLTPEERQLVEASDKADRRLQRNRGLGAAAAVALVCLGLLAIYNVKAESEAKTLVNAYVQEPSAFLLDQLQAYESRAVPLLETAWKTEKRLHAAVGLMEFRPSQELGAEILKRLPEFTEKDFGQVRAALLKGRKEQRKAWLLDLQDQMKKAEGNRALQRRCLWMAALLGDWVPVNKICAVDADPGDRVEFIHDLSTLVPADPELLAELATGTGDSALPAETQSAICLILGKLGTA